MRVAIVGSGLSGLSACWMLKQYSDHEVNLYEMEGVVGGQARGVEFRSEERRMSGILTQGDGKEPCVVDIGLSRFNTSTSPNLLRFLKLLGLPLSETDTSLAVSIDGAFKWSSTSTRILDLLSPRAWRIALDRARFSQAEINDETSIGVYLAQNSYSRAFFDEYLLPHIAAHWLVPDDHAALRIPAKDVLASLGGEWMGIQGGAKTLMDTLASIIAPENLHVHAEITSVSSLEYGVKLVEASGAEHIYDHVILAIPCDAALRVLQHGGWASEEEVDVLRSVKYMRIEAQVHSDDKEQSPEAISYAATPAPPAYDDSPARTVQIATTMDMNKIQNLPKDVYGTIRVAYNPPSGGGETYNVPLLATCSLENLPRIQNTRRISYIGGWTYPGNTPEGAFSSAFELVTAPPFGAVPPFAAEGRMKAHNGVKESTSSSKTFSHAIIRMLDNARRGVSPLWSVASFPIILALTLFGSSTRMLGLHRVSRWFSELRDAWSS